MFSHQRKLGTCASSENVHTPKNAKAKVVKIYALEDLYRSKTPFDIILYDTTVSTLQG